MSDREERPAVEHFVNTLEWSKKACMSALVNEHPHQELMKIDYRKQSSKARIVRTPRKQFYPRQTKQGYVAWCLTHEKRLSGGTYGVDPSNTKTAKVVQKVHTFLDEEAKVKEKRTYVPKRGKDPLVDALEKSDHAG